MKFKTRKILTRVGSALMLGMSLFNLGALWSKQSGGILPRRSKLTRKQRQEQIGSEQEQIAQISQEEAFENTIAPMKEFMLRQVRTKDLKLFLDLSGKQNIESYSDVPISTLIPAFIISELKTGFEIGFLIFIPFIVVDMVVASTLMALGMMMLPPVMISLPFKILLFILVDGWHFIIEKLILSIR